MILYHGSNVEVKNPSILPNLRSMDFCAGFYTTSSEEQAIRWAKTIAKKRLVKTPILNEYVIDEIFFSKINVLRFDTANSAWLDFVVNNRLGISNTTYDVVIGPVANDTTLTVINDYMEKRFTKEIAIQLLQPQNLTDQYVFLTEKSIASLNFVRSKKI